MSVSLDIEVKCDACGSVLDANITVRGASVYLDVEPCSHCLAIAEEAALEEIPDIDEVREEGREYGYKEGYDVGFAEGVGKAKEEEIL